MNQNIEVINENLWAVNFYYLRYIPELEYTGSNEDFSKIASYTNDGKTLLNKHNELYPTLKTFIPRLMKNTDADLELKIYGMKNKTRDSYEEFYMFALELEINRRSIAKEYVKGNKKPLSIIKTIERKVKKWLL
jgi:hypothetical protein